MCPFQVQPPTLHLYLSTIAHLLAPLSVLKHNHSGCVKRDHSSTGPTMFHQAQLLIHPPYHLFKCNHLCRTPIICLRHQCSCTNPAVHPQVQPLISQPHCVSSSTIALTCDDNDVTATTAPRPCLVLTLLTLDMTMTTTRPCHLPPSPSLPLPHLNSPSDLGLSLPPSSSPIRASLTCSDNNNAMETVPCSHLVLTLLTLPPSHAMKQRDDNNYENDG